MFYLLIAKSLSLLSSQLFVEIALLTLGFFSSLLIVLLLGNRFISLSRSLFASSARPFTPASHALKGATPSMGGLLMIIGIIGSSLLWCKWGASAVPLLLLFTLLSFGGIGLLDDLCKAWYKKGISASLKLRLQLLFSFFAAIALIAQVSSLAAIYVPFAGGLHIEIGSFYVFWAMLVIVGTSNAVNLTDGLDGLASGVLSLNFLFFAIVALFQGQLAIGLSSAILAGSVLGFLRFNAYPAMIFMGDVGSLSLGASLAMIALFLKLEIILFFVGFVFVAEALSVILQIGSIKFLGRKVLKMAPLHHHFELLGWKEAKITMRFHIITLLLCFVALLLLFFRM